MFRNLPSSFFNGIPTVDRFGPSVFVVVSCNPLRAFQASAPISVNPGPVAVDGIFMRSRMGR